MSFLFRFICHLFTDPPTDAFFSCSRPCLTRLLRRHHGERIMVRPIRRKHRRGLPGLVRRRAGPFASTSLAGHRYLRGEATRLLEVATKAHMRPEIGSIRPSRLARLRAKALRCRERWCYRAMVPIPPNGPSPPSFPFALVDSSSPPSRTFHTLFLPLCLAAYSILLRHFQPPPPPLSTFLISLLALPFLPTVPFLLIHILRTTGTSTKCKRSRASANPSVASRAKRLSDNNLPFDLTP